MAEKTRIVRVAVGDDNALSGKAACNIIFTEKERVVLGRIERVFKTTIGGFNRFHVMDMK